MKIRRARLLLTTLMSVSFACGAPGDGAEPEAAAIASSTSALTPDQVTKLLAAAQGAIGSKGGQCKDWVREIFTLKSLKLGVTIPATATTQYEWGASSSAVVAAAWRATYAVGRFDSKSVAASSTYTASFSVPNNDPYLLVLYGNVTGSIVNGAGSVAASVSGVPKGAVSGTFSAGGTYTLKVTNAANSPQTFTAVVLSRSRFASDFGTAKRGDVIQMYYDAGTGATPHTTLVQTDGNSGTNNWIDSNFGNDLTVGQHTVSLDQMIRWSARRADFGFTVYRIQ